MPSGFFDLLGPAFGLSAPGASGPALLTGTYYFAALDRPAIGSMTVTTLLDDVAVDDTTTAEVGQAINTYSGACARLSNYLVVTALIDLGANYSLSQWSARVKVNDATPEIPACVLPPEIELSPGYSWALEYSSDDTTYYPMSSGALTEGSYNALGEDWAAIDTGYDNVRYIRLIVTIDSDTYRSSGYSVYARIADFRVWGTSIGTGGGTPDPPGPTISVLGVCEGFQATIWCSAVTGATYYEIWRITDLDPAPGVLVYSGAQPTVGSPFVDSPLPIGRPNTYRVRGCNGSGCGPASEVVITPCYPVGTAGACDCEETAATHTIVEATAATHTIVEPGRRAC